jgi:prepilin-type processing-associated H-X9-DG protein
MRIRIASVVVALLSCSAFAQPLADRVPADAIVYFGWSGADAMPAAYAGSHLKAVVDASNVRELIGESSPRLLERIAKEDDEAAEATALISAIGAPMWRHPSAVYFGGVDFTNAEKPLPKLAFLCDAGKDAKALLAIVQKALNNYENDDLPINAEEQDGLVVVTVGTAPELSPRNKPAAPLSGRKEFQGALAHAGKDPVVVLYADIAGGVAVIETAVDKFAPAEAKEKWAAVTEALGLAGLRRFVYTGGFDGKEWAENTFVESPAPRTGLVKQLLDAEPLSPQALALIPKGSTLAAAGHFDIAALLGEIRSMVKKVDNDASAEFEGGLDAVKQALGMDLQADIFETLGNEWAIYSDPSVGGSGILGLTLVNRLKDAAKAEKAFGQLELLLNGVMKEATAREKLNLSFATTKQGGLTVHYLAVPVVAPSWAVKDGNLYVALYPQIVVGAAEQGARAGDKGSALADNPEFAALRKRLGVENASAFQFTDLKRSAAEGYQEVLMLSRVYLGMADLFGAKTPALVMPPLAKLMPHLGPAGSVSWVDQAGWHRRAISPFPGSEILASGGLGAIMTAQQAMMVGVALPALARSRVNASQVRSASNLRQVGLAMMLYANENNGKFPKTPGELLLTQDITVDVFVNPATKKKAPRDLNKEEQAAWVNKEGDYVYLGAGRDITTPADVVVAHEKFRPNAPGINMLFGDGHVEYVGTQQARATLAKQKQQDELKKGAQ